VPPVATLRYWRHLGTGPRSFRLGRRVLYRRDDLHAWIDAQHGQVTAGPENRR
jgi:predicted DNA-binding transcriptional regulator AlpA